eukprot:7375901-Prymnesium_polylepis.1
MRRSRSAELDHWIRNQSRTHTHRAFTRCCARTIRTSTRLRGPGWVFGPPRLQARIRAVSSHSVVSTR